MLETTPANCRQLFHRAKAHVAARRPRLRGAGDIDGKRQLAERFVSALRDGDGDELTRVLAADVGFWSDGGGKVLAARRPVFGRDNVVHLLLGIRRTAPATGTPLETVSLDIVEVNREPAMALRVSGRLDSIYAFAIEDGTITALRIVRNPDKLRFVERQLSQSSAG
jgi:RNA polymerase sigma-70 factor (ECF subfamily)